MPSWRSAFWPVGSIGSPGRQPSGKTDCCQLSLGQPPEGLSAWAVPARPRTRMVVVVAMTGMWCMGTFLGLDPGLHVVRLQHRCVSGADDVRTVTESTV